MPKLRHVPITQQAAFEFVCRQHRHHKPPTGSVAQVGAALGDTLVGVVILERPKARLLDDGLTLEVSRLAVLEGERNACSFLYGRAWALAKALGYGRLVTYTLGGEPGTSLKAAGWKLVGRTAGGSWNRASRPRNDSHPTDVKKCWDVVVDPRQLEAPRVPHRRGSWRCQECGGRLHMGSRRRAVCSPACARARKTRLQRERRRAG